MSRVYIFYCFYTADLLLIFADGGAGVGKGVVCGRHKCMILNIKTCFDKKVTLLPLVL